MNAELSGWSWLHRVPLWAAPSIASAWILGLASPCFAQTWSDKRERPALFEIVAVDETSEALWPFGQEDLAKDGVQIAMADEAAIDVRSVYAAVRGDSLWLRAYVQGTAAPGADAVVFFFIDSDADAKSGGKAEGDALLADLSADPSPGGYEAAIGMRGDETLLGVFSWDEASDSWKKQSDKPVIATLETGVARDPLRLRGDDHAYFQVEIDTRKVVVKGGCTGPAFVRSWSTANAMRKFGDFTDVSLCKPALNERGDPDILRTDDCDDDTTCPARGMCRNGRCEFDYECTRDVDCRAGQRCTNNVCQGAVAGSGGAGGRAGAGGRSGAGGSSGAGGGGDAGDGDDDAEEGPRVQGGALTCSAFARHVSHGGAWFLFAAVGGVAFAVVRRRRRRNAARSGNTRGAA